MKAKTSIWYLVVLAVLLVVVRLMTSHWPALAAPPLRNVVAVTKHVADALIKVINPETPFMTMPEITQEFLDEYEYR